MILYIFSLQKLWTIPRKEESLRHWTRWGKILGLVVTLRILRIWQKSCKKDGEAICIALLVLKLCLGVRNVVIISNNKNISSNLLENISSNWLKVNFDKFPDSPVPNISKHCIHKILHPFDEDDLNIWFKMLNFWQVLNEDDFNIS